VFYGPYRFAIYIPLFLPISVPILLSSLAAFKWLMKKVKHNNSPSTSNDKSNLDEHTEEGDDAVEEKENVGNTGDISMKGLGKNESYDTVTGGDSLTDTKHSGVSEDKITS